MSYKSKYGITDIRATERDNLSISLDRDTDKSKPYPVFLYTPDMRNTSTHYHVELSKAQAKKLHKWLTQYLKENG
jgi:hypothetical protein